MVSQQLWRKADTAFALLAVIALAVGLTAILLADRWLMAVLALVVSVCSRTLSEVTQHSVDFGRLILLVPLAAGLTLALQEAARLLRATRQLVGEFRLTQCRPPARLRRLARRASLAEPPILVRAKAPLVFTHGLRRPRVWLSTGLLHILGNAELEAVLRHEARHVHAHDPFRMLMARCLSQALFFIPVARDLSERYCVAKEIAADEAAVQAMGDARPLARAIRKLLTSRAVTPALPLAALVGELNVVEARLHILLDPEHPLPLLKRQRLGTSLAWALLGLAVFLAPAAGHLPSLSECTPPAASSLLRLIGV